jgi:hypothetical protein
VNKSILTGVALAALVGCGERHPGSGRQGPPFHEVQLDTADGLSGLATDAGGALWTIAERADVAYKITLHGSDRTAIEAFPVEGVPPGLDLEGIAVLEGDRFAFGTEGKVPGIATVLLGERAGDRIMIGRSIVLPEQTLGIPIPANEGAEGVCNLGDELVVALEAVGTTAGRRWAPIVFIKHGEIAHVSRLLLTSDTGKLSALDCAAEGTAARGWAIERNFGVTKLLEFDLRSGQTTIVPRVMVDLTVVLHGRLNLEGLARLHDGRFVAIVDNQWKGRVGPNELLVFGSVVH